MILNSKGWLSLLGIALISGGISYTIYAHPNSQVVYKDSNTIEVAPTPTAGPRVIIGDNTINVRLATTSAAITHGLSGTLTMATNEGMLFVFKKPDIYRFWMPDMHFGLDMVWISSAMKVVDITRNAPPLEDISKPVFYSPQTPAQYVLEVNAGFAAAHNISIGQKVGFSSI